MLPKMLQILRLIHTCSTIMASIVLWGALAFYLEAWYVYLN